MCDAPSSVLLSSSSFMQWKLSSMRLIWDALMLTSLLRRFSSNSLVTSSPRHFVISVARWLQGAQTSQQREKQSGQGAKINGEPPREHRTPPHLSVSNAPMADPSVAGQSRATTLTWLRGPGVPSKRPILTTYEVTTLKKEKERKLGKSPAD